MRDGARDAPNPRHFAEMAKIRTSIRLLSPTETSTTGANGEI
jgi:hypothetical protein